MRKIKFSALIILTISATGYMIWGNTSLQKAVLQNLQISKPHFRGEACLKVLEEKKVNFSPLGNMQDKKPCGIENAVRIEGFYATKLSGPLTLSCMTALSLANWFEDIGAKQVTHMGSYNCRKIRGSSIMSQHSFGAAVDIAGINGASLKSDWQDEGEKGKYLRDAATAACDYFSNVLTPDYNASQHDHFHLDHGLRLTCPRKPKNQHYRLANQ